LIKALSENFPKTAVRGGASPPPPPPGYATVWLKEVLEQK